MNDFSENIVLACELDILWSVLNQAQQIGIGKFLKGLLSFFVFFRRISTLGHVPRLAMSLEFDISLFNVRKNLKMSIADHFQM